MDMKQVSVSDSETSYAGSFISPSPSSSLSLIVVRNLRGFALRPHSIVAFSLVLDRSSERHCAGRLHAQ